MGTSVDHLYRRQSVYWWQRRIPLGLRIESPYRIARSLRTADPGLARRRARACSAAFDHVIMQFMAESVPARADLVRVLDTVFRRILEDGERTPRRGRGRAAALDAGAADQPALRGRRASEVGHHTLSA